MTRQANRPGALLLAGLLAACVAEPSASERSAPAASGTAVTSADASPDRSDTPGPTFDFEVLGPLDLGASEPSMVVADDGTVIVSAGSFARESLEGFATNFWTRRRGEAATYRGAVTSYQVPDLAVMSGRDSDLTISEDGALLVATTVRASEHAEDIPDRSAVTVGTLRCPTDGDLAELDPARCVTRAVTADAEGAVHRLRPGTFANDRPWLAADGPTVWLAFHDAQFRVVVERSDDSGATWAPAGVMVPSGDFGEAAVDNWAGPIVVLPESHELAFAYTADPARGRFDHTHVYVTRSSDGGATWERSVVFDQPPEAGYGNVFTVMDFDDSNGTLFVSWSDGHAIFVSSSHDGGRTWSDAVVVSEPALGTAVMPAIVAEGGRVDVAFYASDTGDLYDDTAEWRLFLARSADGGATFSQVAVTPEPNHIGAVCPRGDECHLADRLLLELFEVAIDPKDGGLLIAYVETTSTTTTGGDPLPQVVLATER